MPALPPAEQPGSPEDLVRVLRAEGIRDHRVVAAILALLAREVVSVERFGDLAALARANLAAVGLGHGYGVQRRPGRDGR